MKGIYVKFMAVVLVLGLMLALVPATVMAADPPGSSWSTAIKLGVGVKQQVGQNGAVVVDDDKHFYIDVTVPSVVVLQLSTADPSPTSSGNNLKMQVMYADADAGGYDLNCDGIGYPEVNSKKMPLEKDYNYKLMPGRYYIRAWDLTAINCFGWVMLKSVTPAKAQTEPREKYTPTQGLANATIVPGKTYDGLINWRSKLPDGKYGVYARNYYKYIVKNDNKTLKLTASRADTERQNNISIKLQDKNGSNYGYNSLSLQSEPSGTADFKEIPAGTYLVLVDGWPANADTTEYSFRITETVGKTPATKLTLNKSKLTLKKGKTYKLKVKKFTPSTTNPKTVTWKSSKKSVVKVDKNGKIKALKKGKATITAKSWNGTKATCKVTVK